MEMHEELDLSPVAREHAAKPLNEGALPRFNAHGRVTGPCGDTMEFWLLVRDGIVERASFTTTGCGPSRACGSMATSLASGRDVREVSQIGQQDILNALGGLPGEVEHCALLAANTLQEALDKYGRGRTIRAARRTHRTGQSCETCSDAACSAKKRKGNESDTDFADRQKLEQRLCRIRHKIVVLSGKGGVGKSTVAVNLAVALMMDGWTVGLLDADIHGPSIPTMLGLEGKRVEGEPGELLPVDLGGLKVMSLGFFLRHRDDAVIWRGPMKMGALKQFLKDVAWGDLDYLVVDSPPGTGDEPLSVCQLLGSVDGAVVVTTPQKVAAVDVRKSVSFCRELSVPVLGVVENMSGFVCPHCGKHTPVLRSGGGRGIAEDMGVPFLGAIPMDPQVAEAGDDGYAFVHHYAKSPTAGAMRDIVEQLFLELQEE